ncbi:MAG: hypothetical protein ABWY16_12815 [Pedobacter sp.]|uniref:hypothetical protein n=1 Tax=Pedobacter sp. TaxID=1411316 RepID=UPI0033937838
MKFSLKNGSLLAFVLLFPVFCSASAYWMDVKGSGKVNQPVLIKIYYGNIEESGVRVPVKGVELKLTGEFRLSVLNEKGKATNISISLKGDGWEGSFIPKEKGVYQILGINDTHPVVDRSKTGGINIRPVDYLCAAYKVENDGSVKKPVQYLDILTEQIGKQLIVKPFKNGQPAEKQTKLRVFNPENWEKELSVDENGQASFVLTMKGLYIIREDWNDPEPGSYKGVPYVSIRHRCNYFLLEK